MRVSIQSQPDGKLVIDPIPEARSIKQKRIDVTGCEGQALERDIIAAYIAGYDRIEFTSSRILSEQKRIIRKVCHKLIGPEIIEENSTSMVIQDLLNPNELPIKKGIHRMFLITSSMHKDAIRALRTNDCDLAMDVIQRDDEVDRLFLLISKQFKSILCGARMPNTSETSIEEYHDLRMAASPLERIADHAQRIAVVASKLQAPIKPTVMEKVEALSNTAIEIVKLAVDSLFNADTKLANQIIDSISSLQVRIEEVDSSILAEESQETMIALRMVLDSLRRIGDYGSNIAEIAINSAIKDR